VIQNVPLRVREMDPSFHYTNGRRGSGLSAAVLHSGIFPEKTHSGAFPGFLDAPKKPRRACESPNMDQIKAAAGVPRNETAWASMGLTFIVSLIGPSSASPGSRPPGAWTSWNGPS
jgi:hypothetical protein